MKWDALVDGGWAFVIRQVHLCYSDTSSICSYGVGEEGVSFDSGMWDSDDLVCIACITAISQLIA